MMSSICGITCKELCQNEFIEGYTELYGSHCRFGQPSSNLIMMIILMMKLVMATLFIHLLKMSIYKHSKSNVLKLARTITSSTVWIPDDVPMDMRNPINQARKYFGSLYESAYARLMGVDTLPIIQWRVVEAAHRIHCEAEENKPIFKKIINNYFDSEQN